MPKRACVFLAANVEETEVAVPADVLRCAGMDVKICGVPHCEPITCGRGLTIVPDIGLAEAIRSGPWDVLVIPGGQNGWQVFSKTKELGPFLKEQEDSGRWVASICVGAITMKTHGIFTGKTLTTYPYNVADQIIASGLYTYKNEKVVVDGNLISSQGPATTFAFGLTIVEKLLGKKKAEEAAKILLVPLPLPSY